jgi:hypothetical protein
LTIAMKFESIDKSTGENVQNHTEAYYEELASQEEMYLEEREERARAVLIAESPSPSGLPPDNGSLQVNKSMPDAKSNPLSAASATRQLDHAAEELITGDSDDPPLSEEAVAEMLRISQNG